MLEEGYAAATSRRVAAQAGVKPALVHYYFPSMDDLFVAVLQAGAEANLSIQQDAFADDSPLHALWELNSAQGAALWMEFMALANHRKAIRSEIAGYADRFRELEEAAMASALRAPRRRHRHVPTRGDVDDRGESGANPGARTGAGNQPRPCAGAGFRAALSGPVRATSRWPGMTLLHELITAAAAAAPERRAVVTDDGTTATFAEFDRQIRGVAGWVAARTAPGDRWPWSPTTVPPTPSCTTPCPVAGACSH